MKLKRRKLVSAILAFSMLFGTMTTNLNLVYADDAAEALDDVTSGSAITVYDETTSGSSASTTLSTATENFEFWLDDVATDVDGVLTVEPGDQGNGVELVGNGSEKFTPSISAATDLTRGDRTGVNAYKAGSRNANSNDITTIPAQGDGTALLFRPDVDGMITVYFYSTSFLRAWEFDTDETTRIGYTDSDSGVEYYAIDVEAGHTYVFSTTGKTNNCAYAGVKFIVDEPTTVTATLKGEDLGAASIRLIDADLGTDAATFNEAGDLTLYMNHTYTIKTTSGDRKATVNGESSFTVTSTSVEFLVEEVATSTLSGDITSNSELFTPSAIEAITFTNMEDSDVVYTYDSSVIDTANSTYSLEIFPGEYYTSITANGYVTNDRVSVDTTATTNEIYVEDAFDGTYNLPTEVSATSSNLTFSSGVAYNNDTSVKAVAGDTIIVPVSGVQIVTVSGWYAGTWDINGQNSVTTDSSASAASPTTTSYTTDGTETSVTVNVTGDGANYLYQITVTDVVEFQSEISVPGDYDTLTEAIAAINNAADRPEGEDGRVTINLTADIQEQVLVDAPYVTINGNGHEINWYYGQTGFYYSVDSNGYYSESLFRDAYEKTEASGSLWGGVVIVTGDYFRAEDVTFRNTFNYEVTDKEIADGAYQKNALRTKDTDVQAYAYKERSNALYVNAAHIECYNCNILSSQDTLGVNGERATYYAYFKDCTIGGNTDYICGAGTMLFDDCTLQWKTHTNDSDGNNAKIGYITAPKSLPYIFRNCTVTADSSDNGTVLGSYGRTWGSNSTAYFLNTETNGLVSDTWGEMTAGDFETANFNEYNNTANGAAFQTSNGNALTDASLISDLTSDLVITAYLAGWTPSYYESTGMLGDVDMNGILLANDAAATLQYVLNPDFEGNENYNFGVADVDGNGAVEASDAAMILQKVLRSTFVFPAEATEEEVLTNYYVADDADLEAAGSYADGTTIFEGTDFTLTAAAGGVTYGVATDTGAEYLKNTNNVGATIDVTDYMATYTTVTNASRTVRDTLTLTATADNTITVSIKMNSGKEFAVYDTATGAVVNYYKNEGTADIDGYDFTFDVVAGSSYTMGGIGTSPYIYSVIVEGSEAEPVTDYVVADDTTLQETYAEGDVIFEGAAFTLTAAAGGVTSGTATDTGATYLKNTSNVGATIDVTDYMSTYTTVTNASRTVRDTITLTAAADNTITVSIKMNSGKEFAVYDATTGAVVNYYKNEGSTDIDGYNFTFDVVAGGVYTMGGIGTSPYIYSIVVGSGEEESDLDPVTVYVVGDSTGCDYAATADSTYYYKRVGFGTRLGDYLDSAATVVNLALSGRSSKSFLTEDNYTTLVNSISEGDYLIIAFGHNDEKAEADRYTDPTGSITDETSFKYSLYNYYIKVAEDAGATAILATPVVRRTDSGTWSNNQLHVTSDSTVSGVTYNGGDYAEAIRELAEETGVELIDNLNNTKDLYDELTPSESVYLHAWLSSASSSVDNTHLNNYGAAYVAYMMASDIKGMSNGLEAYVGDITAPDKATELVVNSSYVEATTEDLTGDDLISAYWDTTSPWYGTAFGDIGGQSKLCICDSDGNPTGEGLTINSNTGDTNFAITELEDGSVNIRTGDLDAGQYFGKISGTTDSFTLYYMPVDAGSNFELSATATVNSVYAYNQTSFGAICLDSILVDKNAKTVFSYVSAGSLKYTTGAVYQTFARGDDEATTLYTNADTAANDPVAGDVIDLKIVKVGNTFTVTYGDTTATYEKEMEGTVYFGLYTTRCADVTFSNISYNNEVTE